MNFFESMKSTLNENKTTTDNGAIAYETAGKKLLDFNFEVSGFRNESEFTIKNNFMDVFYEDRMTAIKYLFMLGDCRGGLGERRTFKTCFEWLADQQPEIAKAALNLIPEYTRWDILTELTERTDAIGETAIEIVKNQLEYDIQNMNNGRPISLLSKWMPSIKSSKYHIDAGRKMAKNLGMIQKNYRKTLSSLRKYLDVVEVKMCAKKWDEIKYETVPSKANLIYNGAFLRNDEKRRREYLDSLNKGQTKINASVLQPHEITYKYRCIRSSNDTLEALWKALPDLTVENTLVVRDGSGSMTWTSCGSSGATPLDVATALAIYMAEHNSGGWKDKYITFSSNPEIVDLSNCKTLKEKVHYSAKFNDCSNTDIYKTMKLVLETAIKNKMKQSDMPKRIVICSDMQFDGTKHHLNQSLFDSIAKEFEQYNYRLPKICFWNLAGSVKNTIPMQENELGLVLCSSFSIQNLKMFMSGETDPYKVLMEAINSERYLPVEMAIKDVI